MWDLRKDLLCVVPLLHPVVCPMRILPNCGYQNFQGWSEEQRQEALPISSCGYTEEIPFTGTEAKGSSQRTKPQALHLSAQINGACTLSVYFVKGTFCVRKAKIPWVLVFACFARS